MNEINIKRFVDINILKSSISSVSSTRDTVVLLSSEGTAGVNNTVYSTEEWTNLEYTDVDTTTKYVKMYFDNGGIGLYIMQGITESTLLTTIKALPNELIVVASTLGYSAMSTAATTLSKDTTIYGINQKILVASTNTVDATSIPNFAAKYSNVDGAEMTIAAYLSTINVYGSDTVKDYCYTQEIIEDEDITDSVYKSISDANMNVDVYLANAIRNLGGDLKDGTDLVNSYVLIVLHQTLTDRLINLLTQKIKGSKGVAAIYTTICAELNKYVASGYLSTDKIWKNGTKTISLNGSTYTVIEDNTALSNGYYVFVAPIASLTTEEQAAHKAPYVYVILADSYGIRTITINGEVI